VIYPRTSGGNLSAHLLSSAKYKLLQEKITKDEGQRVGKIKDFSPQTDIDIK
jgi:hypothetical protein